MGGNESEDYVQIVPRVLSIHHEWLVTDVEALHLDLNFRPQLGHREKWEEQ